MKKNLTILILICSLSSAMGQTNDISKIGLYKWKEAVFIKPCKIDGKDLKIKEGESEITAPEIISKVGQKFRVLKVIDGAVAIIQILDYTESVKIDKDKKDIQTSKEKKYQPTSDFFKYNFIGTNENFNSLTPEQINSRNYGTNQAYFKVGVAYIDQLATKESYVSGSLAAGVINFPFKFRPQKGNVDFSGAFNFGAGIGYTFRHKSYRSFTHSLISGYSISNIVLDSSNTNQNQGKLASTNNFTAFSFSLGYLIQYQSVQAGLFIGWDRISKINHKEFDWQYQGKPWISVGFGLAIFSGQKEKGNDKQSPTQTDK
jgi:hypothetical protein